MDRERYGPRIGTDGPAQIIEMVLLDVEQEVYGPKGGRGHDGRTGNAVGTAGRFPPFIPREFFRGK